MHIYFKHTHTHTHLYIYIYIYIYIFIYIYMLCVHIKHIKLPKNIPSRGRTIREYFLKTRRTV